MGKTYLLTGGTGFLGRHLAKKLLDKGEVRVLSRSEKAIVELIWFCGANKNLKGIVGDIRDVSALQYALNGVDVVVHMAAMKHIDICEQFPAEAISTNLIATMELLKLFSGDTFIGISTDKAIEPTGCYGATKLLLEKVILEQGFKDANRRYMVVRSGNFFGSDGSVVPKWKQQIRQDNKITLTDPGMTRLFINVNTLVNFIIYVINEGVNGKVHIPGGNHRVINMGNLAAIMVDIYGDKNTKTEITGARKTEKTHEKLYSLSEDNIVFNDSQVEGVCLSDADIRDWLKELD